MVIRIVLILLVFGINLFAQIGGLSATKILSYSTSIVPLNKMEFEPSIGINFTTIKKTGVQSAYGESEHKLLEITSDLFFRFTYGFSEYLEAGFSVPADMEVINFGFKYRYPAEILQSTSLAFLMGVNVPLGDRYYYLTDFKVTEKIFSTGLAYGIAITHGFGNRASIDINIIGQSHLPQRSNSDFNKYDYSVSADYGYYFTEGLQAIIGALYYNIGFNDSKSNQASLVLIPGISIERGKTYGFSLSVPFSIYAKNLKKSIGFGFVLTILLE